jgi:hypothetical protein
MAHKGKATSDVTYNPDDGPEAYNNPVVYSRLHYYTAMAQEVHGPEYDSRTEQIDTDVLMRVGGGKRHGRVGVLGPTAHLGLPLKVFLGVGQCRRL